MLKYFFYFLINIILASLLTIIYGLIIGDFDTSMMVVEIGLMVVIPVSLFNSIFLVLADRLDLLYLKRMVSYLPIILFIIYILYSPLNIAWTGFMLIISLTLINTYWNFKLKTVQ